MLLVDENFPVSPVTYVITIPEHGLRGPSQRTGPFPGRTFVPCPLLEEALLDHVTVTCGLSHPSPGH